MTVSERQIYDIYQKIQSYKRHIEYMKELGDYNKAREYQNQAFGYMEACYELDVIDKNQYDELFYFIR